MKWMLSRRQVLASGAATATLAGIPAGHAAAAPAIALTAERRTLAINGKSASVFGIRQSDGTAGAILAPGQRFSVTLNNRCGESTIVHWHGQTPPVRQDGVTATGFESVIANDAAQGYDFIPRPGTHWMHSHQGLQEQLLMAAPLVVQTAEDQRLDAQEVTVLLHDFTFRDPREILSGLTAGATRQSGLESGMGSMGTGSGTPMPMGTMSMGSMSGTGMGMDLNDIDFDAYLANDRTFADPLVVRTESGGRVRLRLINGATSTAFWIDLGSLEGQVITVDGDPVRPVTVRRFPMAEAQRVDVILRIPSQGGSFPIIAQREGERQRTGIILASPNATVAKLDETADIAVAPIDLSFEARLSAINPLSSRKADRVHQVHLTGNMMSYSWGIDGQQWPHRQSLIVTKGERVALDLVNDTMMAHPMHLHGHHFQVVALNGSPVSGAMRDTVLVPANGSVRIAFDANNPGRWLFHCHNLYHMAVGMMTEVAYVT